MSKTLPQKVLEQIQISSHGLEKMAGEIEARDKRASAAKAMIPSVVEAIIAGGRITDTSEKRAALATRLEEGLQDPVKLMEILVKTAKHRNNEEMARLGQGSSPSGQVKTASDRTSLNSPFVGVPTSGPKESDMALLRGLGLSQS